VVRKLQGRELTGLALRERERLAKSSNRKEPATEITLVIRHNDPELIINRVFKSKRYNREETLTYYTDERGEENIDIIYAVKSKTKWDGNKIVSQNPTRGFADRFDGFRTVIWQISKDGNTIKQTTMIRSTLSPLELTSQPRRTTHTFVRVP
jgi:hypothetical protein